ncbi:MAG: hypothetical protein WD066_10215 [Planctomycetaceae bacterium]
MRPHPRIANPSYGQPTTSTGTRNCCDRISAVPATVFVRAISAIVVALIVAALVSPARAVAASREPAAEFDSRGRSTAVALNYCKASFHRIRRYPSKRILVEEQEKILNNLNLNGIADEAVVKLYADVLEEIGHVDIAEHERQIMRDKFRRAFRQQLAGNLASMGLEAASGHYLGAIRAGAACWWDYRNMGWNRDLDLWKIDRDRMTAVTEKSARFLDTFWKLARDQHIPDRWLVRDDDLDKLEEAAREPDPKVRLRVLERMQPFMECYPPYWYYLARTQQELGQLFAAAETYDHLADLGHGHFRKDELLCGALANRAVIQAYLGQAAAVETAREALGHSTGVWEANLMCAHVLARHGHHQEAVDAILRNLDVGLEREQSAAMIVAVHLHAGDLPKLAARLENPDTLQALPMPALLEAAARLGTDRVPEAVARHLAASLTAWPDLRFGPDDFVVRTAAAWHAGSATISLTLGGRTFTQPRVQTVENMPEVRFANVLDWGSPLASSNDRPDAMLTFDYPRMKPVRLHLRPAPRIGLINAGPGAGDRNRAARANAYHLVAIDTDQTRLHVVPPDPRQPLPPIAPSAPAAPPAPGPNTTPGDGPEAPLAIPTTPPIELAPPTLPEANAGEQDQPHAIPPATPPVQLLPPISR